MRTLPELDEEANIEDPRLAPCDIDTVDGPVPGLCGTLVVPERQDDESTTLSIPIQRIKAQTPGADALPILVLGNGPGQSNFQFIPPKELTKANDLIRVGYRGTDSSVTLECNEIAAVIRETPALTEPHLDRLRTAATDCLERQQRSGHRLEDFTLEAVARDLVAALETFEYERIHVLADGFGLQVALELHARYPDRVERIVATSPAPLGPFLLNAATFQAHLEAIAGRCAASDACAAQTDDLLSSFERARGSLPSRWGFTSVDSGRLTLVTALSLLARESTVRAVDAWASAGSGSHAGLAMMSWLGDNIGQNVFVWGDALAKTAPLALARETNHRDANERNVTHLLGSPARLMLFGAAPNGALLPEARPRPLPERRPDALFIHGTVDPTRAVALESFESELGSVQTLIVEDLVLASEAWLLQPSNLARVVAEFVNGGQPSAAQLVKQPWSFEPGLRLGTMQWFLTVLTVIIPLLLGAFVFLLFRRVKRTIDLERAEHASQLSGGDDSQSRS
ncbi:MAG: hypothetical protein AAF658_06235 [Myxococcota bacterium]